MRTVYLRWKRSTKRWALVVLMGIILGGLFDANTAPAGAVGAVLQMTVSVTSDVYEGTPITVVVRLATVRLADGSGSVRVDDRTSGTRLLGSAPIVSKQATIPIGTLSVGTHRLAVVYVSTIGTQTMTVMADVRILTTPPPTTTTTTTLPPTTTSTTAAPTTTVPRATTTLANRTTTVAPATTSVKPATTIVRRTTTTATRNQPLTTPPGSGSSGPGTTSANTGTNGSTNDTLTDQTSGAPTESTSGTLADPKGALAERTAAGSTPNTANVDSLAGSGSIGATVGAGPVTAAVSPDAASSSQTTTTVPPDGILDITLAASVGDPTSSAPVTVQGKNVAPNSAVTVTLHSTPVVLATLAADGSGSFSQVVVLPSFIEPGDHRLIVSGTARSGAPLQAIAPFTVVDGRFAALGRTTRAKVLGASSTQTPAVGESSSIPGLVPAGAIAPGALGGSMPDAIPDLFAAGGGRFAVLSTEARSKQVIDSQIDLFTLLALFGAAAPRVAARVAKGDARSEWNENMDETAERSREEVAVGDVAMLAFASQNRGLGDDSNTWTLVGTESFDEVTKSVPPRVGRFSPLLARIFADGVYLRAMFGGMWLLGPLLGLLVGEGAGLSGNGSFLPPATGWVIALLVVGLLDAFSGLVGAGAYLLTTIAIGGFPSGDGLRATIGLLTLWFGPILIAAAARPLRRLHPHDEKTLWDRLTDGIMAPLFAAWAARGLAAAQNGLSGLSLPIAQAATTVGWVVAGVVFGRFLIESCAAYYYPERLSLTDSGQVGTPSGRQAFASAVLRATLFAFCAVSVVPWSWQLFVAVGIFVAQIGLAFLMKSSPESLPNSARIFRWTPAGLLRTLVLLLASLALAAWIGWQQPNSQQRMLNGLWLLALPGLLFAVLGVLGRKGERPELRWWHRLLGIPLLALLVYLKF